MRLLVTGADGQLGRALQGIAHKSLQVIAFRRGQLDVTNSDAINTAMGDCRPDVVVNAAAYTAVDRAETDSETAYKVNSAGPAMLAAACVASGAAFIHVSTDFVFDGEQSRPYRPDDRTNPVNVYGASKLAGEVAVMRAMSTALIIRTSWLYDLYGRNFVTTMLRLLRENGRVSVVADQYGSPTSVIGLAEAIVLAGEIIHHSQGDAGGGLAGIRHYADTGFASWCELAGAIREEGIAAGILSSSAAVDPIATRDYPTPARRPRFSALDSTMLRGELNLRETNWRDALARAFKQSTEIPSGLKETPNAPP